MWPQRSRLGRCVGALRSAAMDGLVATPAASSIAAAPRVATTAPLPPPSRHRCRIVFRPRCRHPSRPRFRPGCRSVHYCPRPRRRDAPAISAGRAHEVGAAMRGGRLTKQGDPGRWPTGRRRRWRSCPSTPPHDADDGCGQYDRWLAGLQGVAAQVVLTASGCRASRVGPFLGDRGVAAGARTAAAGGHRRAGLEFVEKLLTRSSPARTRRSGTLACFAPYPSHRNGRAGRPVLLRIVLVLVVAPSQTFRAAPHRP